MRKYTAIAGMILSLIGGFGIGTTFHAAPSSDSSLVLPNCKEEDSRNCVWDAGKSGNGEGMTFIDYHGTAFYADPCEGMPIPNPCDPDSFN